jgi:amino acid transporter
MATGTGSPGASLSRPGDSGLRRDVGLVGATWSSTTSIIGSGWLFAGLGAAAAAGAAAVWGWVIGAVAVVILALVHAELGAMYPVAGGTARFPHLAFGSVAGTSFGFFSWLQAVTVAPIEVYAVLSYGSYYVSGTDPNNQWQNFFDSNGNVTDLGFLSAIGLMAVFTAINFLAIKWLAQVVNVITWWKVAVPVLTIIILFFYFHSGNFTAGHASKINGSGGFMPFGVKALIGAIPGAGIVFSYLGFEQADQLAAELKNPARNLPLAIIISVGVGAVVYILAQIVFIGATPTNLLDNGFAGISVLAKDTASTLHHNAAAVKAYPFAAVAGLAGLGWLSTVLHIDAFVSPGGTSIIYQTSTSRVGYGLARNRYFPSLMAATDRRGVPWFSLIISFLFGIIFLLPFPSWQNLVGLVTGASVLMYAGAPLALSAFRGQVPDAVRPYKVPGAVWFSPLAFVIANEIIYVSGFTVIWKLGVCIVIGYVLIGLFRVLHDVGVRGIFDASPPPLDWKAAQWLPVYLIGSGIISWLGQYPSPNTSAPPVNLSKIPFGWDFLVVAAFSLAIFYWAQYSRLPREQVLARIAAQSAVDEDTPAEAAA